MKEYLYKSNYFVVIETDTKKQDKTRKAERGEGNELQKLSL